jgi:HEAT repeat protein
MEYTEYNKCIEILKSKPKWFGVDENIAMKLECLATFQSKGSPSNIHALIPFLKSSNEVIRQRTAEVIVMLFEKLKSQNQLYDSLKYLPIEVSDIDFFNRNFTKDISVKLIALSSLNHSGYVRQRAIERLAVANHPLAIRFLMIRLGDWVTNVREIAANCIRKYFKDEYWEEFISQLAHIDALKNVGRVDLTGEYKVIVDYILEEKLTTEGFHSLTVSDKARLLYLRKYIERHGFDRGLVRVIIEDSSFLVRIQVLEHLNEINESERQGIILQLLNDKSSQVRLKTLYSLTNHSEKYNDSILKLTSDLSASVRDLARYLLKSLGLNFTSVYRERIEKSQFTIGSILGLAEVSTLDDVGVLKSHIEAGDDNKVKLACLTGIQKLDLQLAKVIAIKLFPNASNKMRKRCIEILSRTWDENVLAETERMFEGGDVVLKRMILTLYNTVGGWDVLPQLIKATADLDLSVKELAWNFLQKWREKALRLFTRPPKEAIDRAKTYYGSINHDLTQIGQSKHKLWDEIKYYLRYD